MPSSSTPTPPLSQETLAKAPKPTKVMSAKLSDVLKQRSREAKGASASTAPPPPPPPPPVQDQEEESVDKEEQAAASVETAKEVIIITAAEPVDKGAEEDEEEDGDDDFDKEMQKVEDAVYSSDKSESASAEDKESGGEEEEAEEAAPKKKRKNKNKETSSEGSKRKKTTVSESLATDRIKAELMIFSEKDIDKMYESKYPDHGEDYELDPKDIDVMQRGLQNVAKKIALRMRDIVQAREEHFTTLDAVQEATLAIFYESGNPDLYHKIIKKVNAKMTTRALNPEVYERMIDADAGELPEDYEETMCTRKRWYEGDSKEGL